MSKLAKAVNAVKQNYNPVHAQYVTFYSNTVQIAMRCHNKKTASLLCDAWASAIRLHYDSTFIVCCNYIEGNEVHPILKQYAKPHRAPYIKNTGGVCYG